MTSPTQSLLLFLNISVLLSMGSLVLAEEEGALESVEVNEMAFAISDMLEVTSPDGEVSKFALNTVVATRTSRNEVIVEIRPDIDAGAGEQGGAITVSNGGEVKTFRIKPMRFRFNFAPSERGPVQALGFADSSRDLVESILAQGPTANIMRSQASVPYTILAMFEGDTVTIDAIQKNGQAIAETELTDTGTRVKRWALPVQLEIPRQQPADGLTIEAITNFTYSSEVMGLDVDAEARSSATVSRNGWTVKRISTVRPITDVALGSDPEWDRTLDDPGYPVGDWPRLLILSLAGTQRLSGLRELGISQWISALIADQTADVAVNSLAGIGPVLEAGARALPAPSPRPRNTVAASTFAEVSQEAEELQRKLEELQAELDKAKGTNWSWYGDAKGYALMAEVEAGSAASGQDTDSMGYGGSARLGYRWGQNWNFGGFVGLGGVAADSDASGQTWLHGGAGIRTGYQGASWGLHINASADASVYRISKHPKATTFEDAFNEALYSQLGLPFDQDGNIVSDDPMFQLLQQGQGTGSLASYTVDGGSFMYGGSVEFEKTFMDSFGFGFEGGYLGGDGITWIRGAPSFYFRIGRASQLRFSGEYVDIQVDIDEVNESASLTGYGVGLGFSTRW